MKSYVKALGGILRGMLFRLVFLAKQLLRSDF